MRCMLVLLTALLPKTGGEVIEELVSAAHQNPI